MNYLRVGERTAGLLDRGPSPLILPLDWPIYSYEQANVTRITFNGKTHSVQSGHRIVSFESIRTDAKEASGSHCLRLKQAGMHFDPAPRVPIGTQVRIRTGIFVGVMGVVTELRQQCKVVIELAAVQQCFSLEVQLEEVEVVNKSIPQPIQASRSM